ncbi:PAS domain-containing protein [Butyricicoccus faecihominis]|uniref:PAS domain-containing protein n=1 Tax=Butyricicoccus faecihominis TaxID=1712515 RepID=UPI002478ACA8|nr:PAS domain-containing protein [Butyricicoccus faecihominis]MCQ5130401.1 PAS domain-containing protein [Butyricicoccus faecihominis]
MMQSGTATAFVRSFFDAYLLRRDLKQTLAYLTEEVQWLGTGKSEMACGRRQVEEILRAEFAEMPDPCEIEYEKMEEADGGNHWASVLLTATIWPKGHKEAAVWFRVSATCVEVSDGVCSIASIHASTPDRRQEEGEFFPSPCLNRSQMEARMTGKALDILGSSIPGGILGGYLEPGFPLYYVNDRILSYLGYTYTEFIATTGGQVVNCIHPEDRERVTDIVTADHCSRADYEFQYRLLKKDGSYIWVNAIGKKGRSEDGRAICISVVRDISAEMEARDCLERQAAEQKRLALQYDHLLQSVLCGIVQYRMEGQTVVFKSANREAIRIFGYTPEEFWARQEWNLADLIVEEDRAYILKAVKKLQRPGDKTSFEYRLRKKKDGTTCWIIGSTEVLLDSDGKEIIQGVYLDNTERKLSEQRNRRLAEQVEASNEILHLALEHTNTCEFYYYPQSGECVVPERTASIYRSRAHYADMPRSFAVEQVDEVCRPAYYEMYERIQRGERTAACEYSSLNGTFWCRVTLSVISSGENGAPQLAVGIVENITRQKEMEKALQAAQSRDNLTGLYNKESGIQLVRDYLTRRAPDEHGVMMLLDMDDFGMIDQEEGGIFADALLQEVGEVLFTETGADNIQIRLGGDEFMLFLKHSSKKDAAVIGPRIAESVRGLLADTEKGLHISVSIGMCSTEVAGDYSALYRCAESTLQYVKAHGKGRAACYLDTSDELGILLTKLYTEEHPINDIKHEAFRSGDDLVSFALDLLGKSKNLDDAVFLLLSRIGKSFHFDRVSIIENNRAFLSYRFTHQWARNRADLQLGQNFYVSEEDFDNCANMYDEDGLADHNVREGISDIASCLHAAIWDHGEYAGSMSFEVDQGDYQWTPEQRKLLKELVKIVPSFIMKSKADAVSQAKTDFLSHMSHEIRTPMNAISGMTTIAKSVVDDHAKILDCLRKIEAANGYLLSLINDILDMSRIESGKLELKREVMDLSQLLAELEALFQAQAGEKHLTLRFKDGRRENRLLMADGLRLNQVLVNIIGNAVKFTDRGTITVRVEELEAEPAAILRFSVIDTGIGIAESAATHIFNAFEQADSAADSRRGGTGLGLSISSRLVQMMGGTLEVYSEVDKGSEFFFTLALGYAEQEPVKAAAQAPEKTLPDFNGCKVLLVEDNELNREIAQTLLEMHGFIVEGAADGSEAVDKFCAGEPGLFEAILMDIRMPVMDGLEATRRIRTSGRPDARSVPIIALSANAFDEDSIKSIASGMNGHLSKPIQMERLLKLLDRCINRKR